MSVKLISGSTVIEVPTSVALMCQTIKHQYESCPSDEIHLPPMFHGALPYVVTYLKNNITGLPTETICCRDNSISPSAVDAQFLHSVDNNPSMLFQIAMAANYLDIPSLVELMSKGIADILKHSIADGKTLDEIRHIMRVPENCPIHASV